MDWSSVTVEDLVDALREVDWSTPPRPVSEFFSRFTAPRSYSKWTSRLKCNLYYYRTNYFIMIAFILGMGFLRKPVAILAAFATGLSIAFLNDSCRAEGQVAKQRAAEQSRVEGETEKKGEGEKSNCEVKVEGRETMMCSGRRRRQLGFSQA